ncbi:MAG: phosphoenolpyruvate synthase [Akkermansiaceae bacterium]
MSRPLTAQAGNVIGLESVSLGDLALVGGKTASLGEMISQMAGLGIPVPGGFAVTAEAYRGFIEANDLQGKIEELLRQYHAGTLALSEAGGKIRELISSGAFPAEMEAEIVQAYSALGQLLGEKQVDVAVRSSATAEDLPDASFAGQQETFLNIRGADALLDACKRCFASLYTDRAISYREQQGYADIDVYLSVCVQKMVRSDRGAAGVMFTLDVDSGFPDVIVIDAAYGLGENVVKGVVNPDEYRVHKKLIGKAGVVPIFGKKRGMKDLTMVYSDEHAGGVENVATPPERRWQYALSDQQIMQLAGWAVAIEKHYGKPMDIEWALDGVTGELAILQARPETVHASKSANRIVTTTLKGKKPKPLIKGIGIGTRIVSGEVMVIEDLADADKFKPGCILVTSVTDPDWVPLMKVAAGLITEHGGRTSHAAIVSRELGISAVIGTGEATRVLENGQEVTINCSESGKGEIYGGRIEYETREVDIAELPRTRTQVMLNVANPDTADYTWHLPSDGIGLARMEFIVSNQIGVHPMALVKFDELKDADAWEKLEALTHHYEDKREFFVERLAQGIGQIAASQYPRPVIVRTSDFKTNEYRDLLGGESFEPVEENPMIGFRGASRYYSDDYREGFALECQALKFVREHMGLDNVIVMIPFCRTPAEADAVLAEMAANGLARGENGLEVYVMAEIPSNILLAREFAQRFDGFSIGSNDLTQLVLGIDRDSDRLAELFDENNEAVKKMIRELIRVAHECGCKVGICGQAPSDKPEFARFLVEEGIDSISLIPDSFVATKQAIAAQEADTSSP